MIGFCPLASGSKGNSIYLGTPKTKLLIDAGLSPKATRERLAEIGVELEEIQAILITHEHTDHISGLNGLALKLGIPVFANSDTAKGIVSALQIAPKFKIFTTGESFHFGDIEIHPFSVPHDTLDPVAFTLQVDGLKIGICTDLGFATTLVQAQLQKCHYLYVEANHQVSMVYACRRHAIYKERVLGRYGHLSNEASGQLIAHVYHSDLKHVHLAHLSEECNNETTALSVVKGILDTAGKQVELSIAPQKERGKSISF
jgi:phosphoribosyl 1,2-cyclic phosphodiesterase